MINLEIELVRKVASEALQRAGADPDAAEIQVNLLLEAELRGRPSHGFLRLPRLVTRIENGVASPNARGRIDWRGSSFLMVDGENGLGPVVAMNALDQASVKARESGISVVAITNNNHLGMLAWYAEKIAEAGLVLVAFTTSEALVHAWGGKSAVLGTNPMAIGVPTAGRPFVLDMATSLVSMGQIHDYAQRGEPLPEGWALDAKGNPTTDAVAAKDGAIAPFGAAKGYALGLAIEVLVVSLTASAIGSDVRGTLDATEFCNKGDLFVVIDPGMQPETTEKITAYLNLVRESGGERKASVPGDRAHSAIEHHLREGVDLPEKLWREISVLAGGSF